MRVLIDLDATPAPAPESARPVPWRTFRVAIAAAVLLLLGAAAAPAKARVFPRVADTGGRSSLAALLTPSTLYTVHAGKTEQDGVEVVARALTPGAPSWRAPASNLSVTETFTLTRIGSVLVISGQVSMAVLDATTGKERWPTTEWSGLKVAGNRVLLGESDGSDTVRLADVETGRILWTRKGQVTAATLDASGRNLVMIDDSGNVRVRSAATGRVLATGSFNQSPEQEGVQAVRVIGDRVYVLVPNSVTAYTLPGLTPAWPVPALVGMPTEATACGELLCVLGGWGITALDPATGAKRWSVPGVTDYTDGVARAPDGRIMTLDPRTGQVIAKLGRGQVTGGLMLRAGAARTEVADLRAGRTYGVLPGVLPYACTAAGDFVACPDNGGTAVWQVSRTGS
ncbi:hypothetical protein ADL15_42890 [Actinoplanes awajinensis subsp. mycoplanecinus]|uniref:Pyrrolo-quinoline quinone repeat domain-containing protein n=1 Tax=Actinoplanes awajinensis subsp. mycoplanecinus TaxID=135947 RepID=A0A101JDX9_9ACTN|nr:hypothetical protein ADL15_42890 [Actinoplanes awajinensis subsp. mycoplanecinus]